MERFETVLFEFVAIHGLNGADGVVIVVVSHKPEPLSRARRQISLLIESNQIKINYRKENQKMKRKTNHYIIAKNSR